jgi:hypothetical protein
MLGSKDYKVYSIQKGDEILNYVAPNNGDTAD